MRYSPKALEQLERIEKRMKAGKVSVSQAFALSQKVMELDQKRRETSPPRRAQAVAVCAHCGHELN